MAPESIELREIHISRVLLVGDRAYKRKKPVRLPFLDYGSLERRHDFCREEVRLNRRLAPDVYRGVRALVRTAGGLRMAPEGAPDPVDHVVEMRRYDEHNTLARRLAAGTAVETEVSAVGRRLAAFHASAARPEESRTRGRPRRPPRHRVRRRSRRRGTATRRVGAAGR
jgi:aminoglycoside phosphotransferase family enzyme